MALTAQAEAVLTPEVARTLVRLASLKTGSPLYDDDLAQDALLRGVIAFRRIADVHNPRALFSKIVHDTVADRWRRHRPNPLLPSSEAGCTPDFEGQLDRVRKCHQVREALALLSTEQSALMELFYLEGLSIGELSAVTRKSRSALKMALMRGRKKIIEAMAASSALPPAKNHT